MLVLLCFHLEHSFCVVGGCLLCVGVWFRTWLVEMVFSKSNICCAGRRIRSRVLATDNSYGKRCISAIFSGFVCSHTISVCQNTLYDTADLMVPTASPRINPVISFCRGSSDFSKPNI